MALKNIRVEPRREIIESAIGITAVLVILPVWALAAQWFERVTSTPTHAGCPWPLGMVIVPLYIAMVGLIIMVLLLLTHALGEKICASMVKLGWDPRPKQRYERRSVWIGGKIREVVEPVV